MPYWAIGIKNSYDILVFQLDQLEQSKAESIEEEDRLARLVHQRVKNLRNSIASVTTPLHEVYDIGYASRQASYVYFSEKEALIEVPENYVQRGPGAYIFANEDKGKVISPEQWCRDRGLVQKVANAFGYDLPYKVRKQIQA